MKEIDIAHFKAFGDEHFTCNLDRGSNKSPKHLLIYGANGSGKTSVQEALRYAFFRTKDDAFERVNPLWSPEDKERKINDARNAYRNKQHSTSFIIKLNGVDVIDAAFQRDKFNAYFIKRADVVPTDELYLQDALEALNYDRNDISLFLTRFAGDIGKYVNLALEKDFFSPIRVSFNPSEKWKCSMIDSEHGLTGASSKLSETFNEASITLVKLLLLVTYVELMKITDGSKDNVLVMDDFVTSLDATNRITISRYVLKRLSDDYQLVILTHNISYYNLFLYIINNDIRKSDEWAVMNLIQVGKKHIAYDIKGIHSADKILKDYEEACKTSINASMYNSFGNRVRQAFEARLHEIVSIMMLGSYEDTKNILELLLTQDTIYYNKGNSLQKLLADLDDTINSCPLKQIPIRNTLNRKIEPFRVKESKEIIETIRELRLYQKVVMHPMSHGTTGVVGWADSEIRHSIELLAKLENNIKSINNGHF